MTKNQIDAISWGVGTVGFIIFLMALFTKIMSFGWGLVILVLGVAAYSYITYRLVKPSLMKEPVVAPKAMIGTEGKVITPLAPEGYIKVQGELWQASSTTCGLEAGSDVVVVGMDGLHLLVIPKNSE